MLLSRFSLRVASGSRSVSSLVVKPVAQPHAPAAVAPEQAPNRLATWSNKQNPRTEAMAGPRFEQTAQQFQPRPMAAIELIAEQPIRLVESRTATCNGGGGALGHPRVFINLDKPGPKPCGYCGLRFEQDHGHHH